MAARAHCSGVESEFFFNLKREFEKILVKLFHICFSFNTHNNSYSISESTHCNEKNHKMNEK